MFKLKEVAHILLASAVIGYVVAFANITWNSWFVYSGFAFLMLLANVLAKKLAAYKMGCDVQIVPWTIKRYWVYESAYFHGFSLPAWLLWPIALAWLSMGRVWWLVVSTFEVSATRSRIGRKFAELTEGDIALIAAAGICINLALALISAYLGFKEFMFMNLWFVFFNMLPFPAYDGGRILFGDMFFYLFFLVFSMAIIILLHIITSIGMILISALILAVILVLVFWGLIAKPLKF